MTMDDYVTIATILGTVAYVINSVRYLKQIRARTYPRISLQICEEWIASPKLAYKKPISHGLMIVLPCLLLLPEHPQTAFTLIACVVMLVIYHHRLKCMRTYLEQSHDRRKPLGR